MAIADPKPVRQLRCKRGHDLTNAPLRNGSRHCRECARQRNREYKARHRDRLRETRKRYEKPQAVTCPDCGEIRMVKGPAGERCKPCANRAAMKTRKSCARCGKEFYRSYRESRYCSFACRKTDGQYKAQGKKFASARQGKGNPNYRHGRRLGEHITGWSASAKGELFCRVCGSGDMLQLHHAVPRSVCPPDAKTDLRNGLTLCVVCHMKWHRKTLTIHRDVFTEPEWSYISTLELTGRDITGWLDKHYPAREPIAA